MTTEEHQAPEGADAPDTSQGGPEAAPKGRGRKGGGADIVARLAGLGAGKKTAPPTKKAAAKKMPAKTAKKTAAPAKKTAAKKAPAAAATPAAMPAEQEAPRSLYSARITFTTTPEQRRALELAKVDDGIDKTARIRAMVALWEQDDRLRRRVDKLARTME